MPSWTYGLEWSYGPTEGPPAQALSRLQMCFRFTWTSPCISSLHWKIRSIRHKLSANLGIWSLKALIKVFLGWNHCCWCVCCSAWCFYLRNHSCAAAAVSTVAGLGNLGHMQLQTSSLFQHRGYSEVWGFRKTSGLTSQCEQLSKKEVQHAGPEQVLQKTEKHFIRVVKMFYYNHEQQKGPVSAVTSAP